MSRARSAALSLWRALRGPAQWRILWLRNSKYMVGVSIYVFALSGEVLLLKHKWWTSAKWGPPTGYMEAGESVFEAGSREIREETGLDLPPEDLRLVEVRSGFKLRLEVCLTARVDSTLLDLIPEPAEIEAIEWHSLESARSLLSAERADILTNAVRVGL